MGSVGMGQDWVLRWRVYRGTFCVAWLDCSSSKYVIAVMRVELVVKSWILVVRVVARECVFGWKQRWREKLVIAYS